ncbi:hypothetical protein BHE74_00058104 [Ensete ventricosum]|nr:hypothetical protein BHE74_00058104 [Ensete ventricosum]
MYINTSGVQARTLQVELMSRDEWSCGAQASAVDPCTIVHLRRELRSSLNSAECIGERSRVVADHYRSSCRRRKGSVGRDGVRRIEAADSRRSGPPASLNASFNSTRPCKKLPSVSCGLRFFSRNRICFPLSIIERVALWDVWQCNLAMKYLKEIFPYSLDMSGSTIAQRRQNVMVMCMIAH